MKSLPCGRLSRLNFLLRTASRSGCRWLRERAFNIQVDFYFIAHHDTAAFNGPVPRYAIILTIQRSAALDPEASMPFSIIDAPADRKGKLDLFGHAFHRKVSNSDIAVPAFLDSLALEGDLR